MFQIIHQRHKCIGCNACVEEAPNQFEMDVEDGKSTLENSEKKGEFYIKKETDDELEQAENASESCPVDIIHVRKL